MIKLVALGIGAGLVSALLFASSAAGSIPSVILTYLAPLPILIVALGWHHMLGLLALASGGFALSLVAEPPAALLFAFGPGFAGWFLATVALATAGGGQATASPGAPPGRSRSRAGIMLFCVAMLGAGIAFGLLAVVTGWDFQLYRGALDRATNLFLRQLRGEPLPRVFGMDGASFIRRMMELMPGLLAGTLTLVLATNLWIAGRAVRISGRLWMPWPDLPSARMPLAAVALAGAGVLAIRSSGFVGVAGLAVAGALMTAFALQGLAVVHDLSRNHGGRRVILSVTYGATLILAYLAVPLLAVLGITDSALPLRRTLGGPRPPPPPPSSPPPPPPSQT